MVWASNSAIAQLTLLYAGVCRDESKQVEDKDDAALIVERKPNAALTVRATDSPPHGLAPEGRRVRLERPPFGSVTVSKVKH
jgi:hypothetical protein